MDRTLGLLKGYWTDLIFDRKKKFDVRVGHRPMSVGDIVRFVEIDENYNALGREVRVRVNLVAHSDEFPKEFGFEDILITIIQFEFLGDE